MTEETGVEYVPVERRIHARHKAKTAIVIIASGKRIKCQAVNLSAGGVALKPIDQFSGLGLKVGSKVEMTFVINLGDIAKLHRRSATVRHVKNGITGFSMEPFGAK